MNSQTSTIQTKAKPNKPTADRAKNISAMKCLLKIKTYNMTFRQISRHFVSGSFEKVAWVVHASYSIIMDESLIIGAWQRHFVYFYSYRVDDAHLEWFSLYDTFACY